MNEHAQGPVPDDSGHSVDPDTVADGERMDKVRNLLFGSQMRDYDRRFAELAERVRSEGERLREEQDARLARLETFLRTELERLDGRLQQERQERQGAQQEQDDRIESRQRELAARIESLDARLSKEALDLRGELQAQADGQLAELHRSHRELGVALETQGARLHDEKTGRDELAQLFTELGLRLNRELELPQP